MRSFALGLGFAFSCWVMGCGGNVVTTPHSGDGGSIPGTGNAGGDAGNATPQSDGGPSTTDTPSCESACTRVAMLGCSEQGSADCTAGCHEITAKRPQCQEKLDAALRCLATASIQCINRNTEIPSCEGVLETLNDCTDGRTTSPPAMQADAGIPVSAGCADYPTVPRGLTCEGSGGAGSGGPQQCTTQCKSSAGDVWESSCSGSTCTCSYNGTVYCTCVSTDGCGGCCPGL